MTCKFVRMVIRCLKGITDNLRNHTNPVASILNLPTQTEISVTCIWGLLNFTVYLMIFPSLEKESNHLVSGKVSSSHSLYSSTKHTHWCKHHVQLLDSLHERGWKCWILWCYLICFHHHQLHCALIILCCTDKRGCVLFLTVIFREECSCCWKACSCSLTWICWS